MTTKGQLAYEERTTSGDSWADIASRNSIASSASACSGAKKYAFRQSLPWPPPVPLTPDPESELQAEKDAKVYAFIEAGGHYHEVEGMLPTQIYKAIDRHIDRTGAEVLPRNPQRAYEMRENTDLTWREIATRLGYKNTSNAMEAARSFANVACLPWPLGSS